MNAAVTLLGRVLPATVHIRSEIPPAHPSARLLGTERMGTGVLIDPAGLLLTASYVVLGADRVQVTLLDKSEWVGTVLKYDFRSGLGLVRCDGEFPWLPLRRSSDVVLGEEVFSVASVGPGQARIGTGAVTYLGAFDANWEWVLDRAIATSGMSPGLGGGPLLDRFGRVAGIVSLNLNEVGRFALAVPSECYLDQEQAFLSGGARGMGARAWLGIFCYTVNGHVVVAGVLPGGPGDAAGLRSGDVVVAVDGREPSDRASFYRWLWERAPGAPVALRIARGGETREVVVPSGDPVAFFAQ